MARPARSITNLSDTLHMADCHDGFWLYDDTRGMNLSMRAKTTEEAFVEALTYYQKRLKHYEDLYSSLKSRVDMFVESFAEEEEPWDA
jgi:hypothetical protein